MEEQKNYKKNHWTQTKVDNATKKINQDIYGKSRQASVHIKIDDLSIYINESDCPTKSLVLSKVGQ